MGFFGSRIGVCVVGVDAGGRGVDGGNIVEDWPEDSFAESIVPVVCSIANKWVRLTLTDVLHFNKYKQSICRIQANQPKRFFTSRTSLQKQS